MNCPRCAGNLNQEILKETNISIEVDRCEGCGGTWFDKGELNKVEEVIEPVFFEMRKIPSEIDQLAALHCPTCELSPMLLKAEHHRDEKVIIDYCDTCYGVWLDKGELEAIRTESWLITIKNVFAWLLGKEKP